MAYMLSQQPDDAPEDPMLQGIFESLQKSIEDLEAQVKAEEENIKNYQRVLRESGQALSQLKTALQKQKEVRSLLTDRLAGDPEFVKTLEGGNIKKLEGMDAEAGGKFESYEKQVEEQSAELGEAYEKAKQAYNIEVGRLGNLEQLRDAYQRQTIRAAEAYNFKVSLKDYVEGADADSEYVRNFLRAMGESQDGVLVIYYIITQPLPLL